MRRTSTLIALSVLAAVLMGVVGCGLAEPWEAADEDVAALARDIADKAAREDVDYFKGLTPARERVAELMEQVEASGLATNYAEHLNVESDTDATLVYEQDDDETLEAPFSIQLSLHDGKPRVDLITIGEHTERAAVRVGTTAPPSVSSEATAAARVAVAIPSKQLAAGSWQSALVGYTNTSNESSWVPQPLDGGIVITYATGEPVSERTVSGASDAASAVRLAPFQSIHTPIRFRVPGPGLYLLYGHVNGLPSPVVDFRATAN